MGYIALFCNRRKVRMIADMSECFNAVFNHDSRVLILGSMPGVKSLEMHEYYAHPRNAFWPIMSELLGFDNTLSYEQRLLTLKKSRIALWDVIASCERQGSLDSAISPSSIVVNDFPALFAKTPKLEVIALNGNKSYELFMRHMVKKGLCDHHTSIIKLPSTSPANARIRFDQKLKQWQNAILSHI